MFWPVFTWAPVLFRIVSHPWGLPFLDTNGLRSSESDEEVLIARLRASLAAPWRDELDECYLWYATPMISNSLMDGGCPI